MLIDAQKVDYAALGKRRICAVEEIEMLQARLVNRSASVLMVLAAVIGSGVQLRCGSRLPRTGNNRRRGASAGVKNPYFYHASWVPYPAPWMLKVRVNWTELSALRQRALSASGAVNITSLTGLARTNSPKSAIAFRPKRV